MRPRRRPQQLELPSWGGRRVGAGRKPPPGRRSNVAHVTRPVHAAAHPVHVTLRARRDLPSLRTQRMFWALAASIKRASHSGFRVIEFSLQDDHIHVIVEAPDKDRLTRGVQGFAIRLARCVNRIAERRGKVWSDRYHARDLRSPREVRNALVYVLMNARRHRLIANAIDAFSSARWFDGWNRDARAFVAPLLTHDFVADNPSVAPRTWLAREGWRRRGRLAPTERPNAASSVD